MRCTSFRLSLRRGSRPSGGRATGSGGWCYWTISCTVSSAILSSHDAAFIVVVSLCRGTHARFKLFVGLSPTGGWSVLRTWLCVLRGVLSVQGFVRPRHALRREPLLLVAVSLFKSPLHRRRSESLGF